MSSSYQQQKINFDTTKLQECFNEFTDNGKYAHVSQLPNMIEYLHFPLPDNFVEKTYIEFQLKDDQKFTFEKFCEFLQPRNRDKNEWKKLHDAFEVFDNNGNGKISISELSEILVTFGNVFKPEEINHMKAIAKPDENDLVDINLITDLLVDDMFDNLEEEEEEEENIDKVDDTKKYNDYREQSNDYKEQLNDFQDQSNEYQQQSNYSQQFSNDQLNDGQEQSQDNQDHQYYDNQEPQYYDNQEQYFEEEEEEFNESQGQFNE